MIDELVSDCHQDLCSFASKRSDMSPPWVWTVQQIFRTLQQYPSGLTRSILLTEVDTKWNTALKRGEHAGRLKQVLATSQLATTDILQGEVVLIDEFRCRLSSEGANLILIIHRQHKDWLLLYKEWVDAAGPASDGHMQPHLSVALIRCTLLRAPPQPVLLLPSALGVWTVDHKNDTHLMAFHNQFIKDITADFDNVRCGLIGQVQEVSACLPYPGATSTSAHMYRTVLFLLPEFSSLPACPSMISRQHGGQREVVRMSVSLGELLKAGEWMFLYRPCVAPNREEPTMFGTDTQTDCHEGVNASLAYRVIHRTAEHISSTIAGSHHLLYGTLTALSRVSGWNGSTTDVSGDCLELPCGERIPVGRGESSAQEYTDYAMPKNRLESSKSISPLALSSLQPGLRGVSLLGRVLYISSSVVDDGKIASLVVYVCFMPSSTLHATASNTSYCLITCSASLEDTNGSLSSFPLALSVKIGHQLFFSHMTVVTSTDHHDLMSSDGKFMELLESGWSPEELEAKCTHHLSLPSWCLSQLIRPATGASAQQVSLWTQLTAADRVGSAGSGTLLTAPTGSVVNISRIVGLSTSPGIMKPYAVSRLFAAGAIHPSCWGCLVMPGTIVGEWLEEQIVECVGDATRCKRRRIASDLLGDTTQFVKLGIKFDGKTGSNTDLSPAENEITVHAMITSETICTASSVHVNKSDSFRISTADGNLSHHRLVFVLAATTHCVSLEEHKDSCGAVKFTVGAMDIYAPTMTRIVYRIESIVDENIGSQGQSV